MNTEILSKLQDKQLEILDEIHRICTANNLKYYIIGGTALGAVRHKGFIPWDLDIDIAMPRCDYEQFPQVCNAELDKKYSYSSFKNEKNFIPPHALININNTTVSFKGSAGIHEREHIFLDIFPLDNAPNDIKLRKKQAKQLQFIAFIKRSLICRLYKNNSFIKNAFKKLFQIFLKLFYSIDTINKKQDKIMRRYEFLNDSECICSMASHYSYSKQCMDKSIYGNPTLIEFAGKQYYGPEKIHEYLERIYGDYMRLPSKEEQESYMNLLEDVVFEEN